MKQGNYSTIIVSVGMTTLEELNSAIQLFDYGDIDVSNKPSAMSHLQYLNQSG